MSSMSNGETTTRSKRWLRMAMVSLVTLAAGPVLASGLERPVATGFRSPVSLALVGGGQKVVTANAEAGTLSLIDLEEGQVLAEHLLGEEPAWVAAVGSDQVLQILFPVSPADYPSAFDLQALTLAFTTKIATASFWLAVISLVPLPRLDGFVALVSLAAYLRQRRHRLPSPPLSAPAPVPTFVPGKTRGPINQYRRRDNISDLHFKLGTEYHQANKFDDAIARYRQALENDKNFGPAYVNLGLAYLGKGKRREAIHAFRGAVQFSDDQKSKQEAWYQLHQLSGVSPVGENADQDMIELGTSPWTDTKPRPNWLTLWFGGLLLLVAALSFYSYLFSGLVKLIEG